MPLNRMQWQIKATADASLSAALVQACGDQPLLARLLALRGIQTPEAAKQFLNIADYLPTPPTEFPDLPKALERLATAISKQEPILIYGDFDVDGITGTSILLEALRAAGASVSYYVPDRHTEGHGMHTTALVRLVSSRKVKLVISTDTGITNFNEVNLLNGLGVDTIITDHHEIPENLPPALAILNPRLLPPESPFYPMCGAGTAYQLSKALLEAMGKPASISDALLDLVAIGTVVDMVPLVAENRYLVWRGLQVLNQRHRLGLKALLTEANVNDAAPIDATTLGFVIGPRLNAIGRLTRADEAVELMTTADPEQARVLAAKLEQLNRRRKELVETTVLEAESHLSKSGSLSDQKALLLASESWNPGIVGLVATRLIEKYNRPTFIGMIDTAAGEIRFSGRSIPGFHMHQHLQGLEDLFIRWGGHAGAAGFSIKAEHYPQLKQRLLAICDQAVSEADMSPELTIDAVLTPEQLTLGLVEILSSMAPFGQENPQPIFALTPAPIGAQRLMGEKQNHLKLLIQASQGAVVEALSWNWGTEKLPQAAIEAGCDLAFTVEKNQFEGVEKLQLLIKDVRTQRLLTQTATQTVTLPQKQPTETVLPVVESANSPRAIDEAGPQWLDHRQHADHTQFLNTCFAQAPEALQQGLRIYCEGVQKQFPYPLPEACWITRETPAHPAETLILWDLPPDPAILCQLLRDFTPQTVHLMGSKYRQVPLFLPPLAFLKGLKQLLNSSVNQTLTVTHLASRAATTESVIYTALAVLEALDGVSGQWKSEATYQVQAVQPVEWESLTLTSRSDYRAFAEALAQTQATRDALMQWPVSVIKQWMALPLASTRLEPRPKQETPQYAIA